MEMMLGILFLIGITLHWWYGIYLAKGWLKLLAIVFPPYAWIYSATVIFDEDWYL